MGSTFEKAWLWLWKQELDISSNTFFSQSLYSSDVLASEGLGETFDFG